MHATSLDRPEFMPSPSPGRVYALGLAILAHLLLLAALTWGVNWRHDADIPAVEAELWSSVPQQAAAPAVAEPMPQPEPEPKPEPPPPAPAPAPKVDAGPSAAQIALAKEKEKEKERKEKLAMAQRLKEERAKEQERKQKEKQEQLKREQEKKLAEEKKKKEQENKAKLKQQEDAKLAEKMRQENLKRMTGMAGATGSPNATGNALKSSGPSATYAGRIVARVKPNIVFTEDIDGNPSAEVEVRCAPDGTITGSKLVKSSGNKSWDDAVLNAITKTEVLPRDTDGRVPSTMIISFRPRS